MSISDRVCFDRIWQAGGVGGGSCKWNCWQCDERDVQQLCRRGNKRALGIYPDSLTHAAVENLNCMEMRMWIVRKELCELVQLP